MPYRSKSDESSMDKDGNNESIMDSDFIPLDDLVYAPLYAIAKSNQQLRADILQSIRAMGTSKQNGQEEVIHMNNINIAYDQIRPEGDDGYSVDNLQVQVPLLSMVPVTNLGVDKAEINFSTEVKAVDNPNTGERKINARICSPSQRESDFLPKISYKLQVSSIPATEGILRLTDALSSSQVAKKIGSTPIAISGDFGTDEQKNIIQKIKVLKAKIGKLNQLHQKISEMIDEQERLHQLSKDSFEEDTYEFDRDKYKMAQSNIINRIMEYKEEIMNMEISYGLDKDYE
ncbi:DUF2589 domain-containing protein [Pseudobutyrivibrio sp.]|uniref:DUF2589 domain-containing protein n=1 Tax=Pseudobutyrivibrio sp. TaxID=2014367 RepID=UPI001B67B9DB|nr:DUF2589 domain-containing protein [Pseudobutyrivibrio sp.]MBP5594729.1 DUF2589 domain-containing protein [Pseudobutyrivibrio sp.]